VCALHERSRCALCRLRDKAVSRGAHFSYTHVASRLISRFVAVRRLRLAGARPDGLSQCGPRIRSAKALAGSPAEAGLPIADTGGCERVRTL